MMFHIVGHVVLETVEREFFPKALLAVIMLCPQLAMIVLVMNIRTLDEMSEQHHSAGNLCQSAVGMEIDKGSDGRCVEFFYRETIL